MQQPGSDATYAWLHTQPVISQGSKSAPARPAMQTRKHTRNVPSFGKHESSSQTPWPSQRILASVGAGSRALLRGGGATCVQPCSALLPAVTGRAVMHSSTATMKLKMSPACRVWAGRRSQQPRPCQALFASPALTQADVDSCRVHFAPDLAMPSSRSACWHVGLAPHPAPAPYYTLRICSRHRSPSTPIADGRRLRPPLAAACTRRDTPTR